MAATSAPRLSSLLRPTLTRKIGLIFVLFSAGAAVSLGVFWRFLRETAHDSEVVNVAGRQRTLCGEMADSAGPAARGDEQARRRLATAAAGFAAALEALHAGGEVGGHRLPPVPRGEVRDALERVRARWSKLRPQVERLEGAAVAARPAVGASVRGEAEALRLASEEVVVAYERRARGIRNATLTAFVVLCAADAVLLVAGIVLTRRHIQRPIVLAADVARSYRAGERNRRMPALGRDELGEFAVAFNDMADHVAGLLEEVSASQRRYRELLEEIDAVVWEADAATRRFSFVSRQAEALLGYPVETWLEEPGFWEEVMHPEDRERAKAECTAAVARAANHEHEFRMRSMQGSTVWFHCTCRLGGGGEAPPTLRGVMVDVTRLKAVEHDLGRKNRTLQAVIRVLTAFLEGRPAQEVAGLLLARVLDGARANVGALIAGHDRRRPRLLASRGLGAAPPPAPQSEGERELPALPAELEPAWRQALEGRTFRAAAAGLEASGGEPGTMLCVPVVRDAKVTGLLAVVDGGGAEAPRAGEEYLDARIGTAGMILETYHRSVAERALERQLQQAQRLEAVGRLAGGNAHDFNNLLSVIHGSTSLMLEKLPPGSREAERAGEVLRASERAAALTAQLLAYGRRQMLQPRVVDLNRLFESMGSLLRRLIGEDIDLAVVPAPGLDRVRVDPARVEQVIMNLAVNARDAMPRGGKLTLETTNVYLDEDQAGQHVGASPGRHVVRAVTDTGTGMDAATQARLFEPFFTTKAEGKGTGLGLATVFGIVRQSGGTIWVYSEPGRGSTFKIYLRGVDAPADTPAATPVSAPSPVARGETVLVVEDDPAVRSLVRNVLEGQDYAVLVADSGDRALAIAAERGEPIHLLLTDVVLPRLSGREMAQRFASRHPESAVLFLPGYTANAIAHQGLLDEGVSFLPKPFSPAQVAARVREILDRERRA